MKGLMFVLMALAVGAVPAMAQRDTVNRGIRNDSPLGGWLGIGLSCSSCSAHCEGNTCAYTFSEPPTVFSVDVGSPADRAGIRTGDTLLLIDGWPLTTPDGGKAFGMIRLGQEVTLRYRRDGRDVDVRMVPGVEPTRRGESLALVARTLAQSAEDARRLVEQSQRALDAQREATQRMLRQLELQRSQLDSARLEQIRRSLRMLDSVRARWRTTDSLWAHLRPAVVPAAPVSPEVPAAQVAPMAAAVPVAPVPALTYAQQRAFGPLRYSGRLADVVIEARSPGAVTTTEASDSEVVVTSRDLSVRIAIRPRATPAARPQAMPKPAPTPRPVRTPRTPKPAR